MKNKIKLNKLRVSYFKLPNKLHTSGLSSTAIALYSYLAKGAEDFNPSVAVVSKALQLSETTVVKYYNELKTRNVIKVIQKGREGVTTKYEFSDISDWT